MATAVTQAIHMEEVAARLPDGVETQTSIAQPDVNPPLEAAVPLRNTLPSNKDGCVWVVDGAGSFTHSQTFDFSTMTSFPTEGLAISLDQISSSPYTQLYTPSNVAVGSGSLQLRVPGGQTASPILGAEIYTQNTDILYGSVRTTMKASTVAGTCHGAFFYKNDNQEADIEIITGGANKGVHYTNQKASDDANPSTIQNNLPSEASTGFLEYRIDWVPGRTDFYVDGTLQTSLTENVPSTAGTWLWNNWSNGGPKWTGAPPLQDSVMEISKIEMYYNRTGSAGSC
ncbi:MAG: hypothetical protein ASARMPRED_000346 [Alectoria sarmentosa]|nr:MAG: hypothetical protein ASARMPRED_000346 [Alectoria sarmentosa]